MYTWSFGISLNVQGARGVPGANGKPGRGGTRGEPGDNGELGDPGLSGASGKEGTPGGRGFPGRRVRYSFTDCAMIIVIDIVLYSLPYVYTQQLLFFTSAIKVALVSTVYIHIYLFI